MYTHLLKKIKDYKDIRFGAGGNALSPKMIFRPSFRFDRRVEP